MTDQAKILDSISQALALLAQLRRRSSEVYFDVIEQELNRLDGLAKKRWPLSAEIITTLWLGPFAVRNLEEPYPEFSSLLQTIHYLCKAHLEPVG